MVSVLKAPFVAAQQTINVADRIKNDSAAADKFSKSITNTYKAVMTSLKAGGVQGVYQPLANLMKAAESFSGLVTAFHVVNRLAGFFGETQIKRTESWDPMKASSGAISDYRWKCWNKKVDDSNTFQDDGYWSLTNVGAQTFLTAAQSLEFVRFGHSLGFYDLGSALAPLTLAKNIIFIPASSLGIWDAVNKMSNADKYVAHTAAKVEKWRDRAGLGEGYVVAKDTLIAKYKQKIESAKQNFEAIEARLDSASGKEKKGLESSRERIGLKIERWRTYTEELGALDEDNVALPEDSQFRADCEWKATQWQSNVGKAKFNAGKEKTKSWLSIVENIGKLVFGILGILGLVFGIALNPAFLITIAVGSALTNAIGVTKILYGSFNQLQKIEKPRLVLVPAPKLEKEITESESKTESESSSQ